MAESQFETRQLQVVTDLRVFAPFYGAPYKVMQRLLTGEQDGQKVDFTRLPINVSKLEQVRLGRLGTEADKQELRKTYVHTATLILPDPKSNALMTVPEHPLVYLLSGNTRLEDGKLPITRDMYEASRKLPYSFEFSAEQVNALGNRPYDLPKVRRAAWESWNCGDTELTDAYIIDVEKSIGYKFKDAMGRFISESKGGRLLCVGVVDGDSGSDAGGDFSINSDGSKLFGEVAEPQDVARKIEKAKNWVRQFPGLEERL